MHFTLQSSPRIDHAPRHTAIIMDGNGRWAAERGWPRIAGHHAGSHAVRRTVEAAPDCGIEVLTLYAFSSDNWKRPREETDALMVLLTEHLQSETERCVRQGVRMSLIGRRDRLPSHVLEAADFAEQKTADGERLHLRLAVDYSARDAIVSAAQAVNGGGRECFARMIGEDVDLLIRTGGERRLSDFLLWECAYAELVFTTRMWPEFDANDLGAAVAEFRSRQRRFGDLEPAVGQSLIRHVHEHGAGIVSDIRRDRWLR
jgi:undecaprenyl diphosphate synthase